MLRRIRTRRTLVAVLLVGLHLLSHVRPSIAAIGRARSRSALAALFAALALALALALASRVDLRVVRHTADRNRLVLTRRFRHER